jgi:hypothetical protein
MPDKEKEAKRRWYDEQIINWSNPCHGSFKEEAFSVCPVRWCLGDAIEELDLVMSLQECPIILPGITTRRWYRNEVTSRAGVPDAPDLLIALDVSGSMVAKSIKDLYSRVQIARLASFAVLNSCEESCIQSASIVFSGQKNVKSSNWSVNTDDAKKVLMEEYGGNTIFPVKNVDLIISETLRLKALVVMTDSDLHNWAEAEKYFLDLLRNGHKVLMYIINGNPINEAKYRSFTDTGGFVGLVRSLDDLYSDWSSQLQIL